MVFFWLVTIFCIFPRWLVVATSWFEFSTSAHHDKIKEDKTACAKNYPKKQKKIERNWIMVKVKNL